MMKRNTFLGYLSDVFMIFGVTTLVLNTFSALVGEYAAEVSTIFSMRGKGIADVTSVQFLLTIAADTALRYLFMTDIIIKNMSRTMRIVWTFISAFAVTCAAAVLFGWLPADMPLTWVMFVVCFAVSCTLSTVISYLSEKQENNRLEAALKRFKEEN